ncbi:MAG: helix-turn-helix domain-containing protein, partial [Bifidobacterium breve]|nr:helix-turn-helix domain-containing protein [Bifidobacterium breve]
MSNIALSWAFRCHVGNASAKAVLVYLADRADDDGTAAYPKIATIVNVTELSERTVRAALKTLQERGFIRRGDQRYARLGKGGRNRLPQYCQVVWDLAVESDPSTLTWIRETHTAEQDPATMGGTVDPMASTIVENGESKDVLPENVGTKPISSTANLAGLENDSETALQIPQGQHCESCTPSTANAAPPALQISQGCIYKDKTLQVNPPSKPSFPSAPTGHLPASGATAAEKNKTEQSDEDDTEIAEAAGRVLASLGAQRSMLGLATPSPTKADRKAIIGLYRRLVDQGAQWPTLV